MATTGDDGWGTQDAAASQLIPVLTACRNCESIEEFKDFIKTQLRKVFPHQIAMCGLCETRSKRILRLINVDFPVGYLRRVIRPDQVVLSGPLREWLRERRATVVYIGQNASRGYSADRDYGITNFACHGVVDLSGAVSSYFAFARLDYRMVPFEKELLGFVVPHLHETVARLLAMGYLKNGSNLSDECTELQLHHIEPQSCAPLRIDITEREREVLRWIAGGKSNWEIGRILQISEFTVKNHVQRVLRKLSVTSRAHAVTKAISSGLIARSEYPPLAQARLPKRLTPRSSRAPSRYPSGEAFNYPHLVEDAEERTNCCARGIGRDSHVHFPDVGRV